MKIARSSVLAICALALLTGNALAQAETVTLRLWDSYTEPKRDQGMKALIATFEEKHPNIRIERDIQAADDMRPIIQTSLASGTGPDIFNYDAGPGSAGVLAKAGLLMSLDDAYKSQGWDHIYPWIKERVTFDGKAYGIGNSIEFFVAYYNRSLFTELGLEPPTTYAEFLAVCQSLRDAGKIPVAFANRAGWPAFHLFSIWANNFAGKEKMEELIFNGGSWTDPAIVAAIKAVFVDMNQADYLIPDTNAVAYDDAVNLFTAGQAGMHISGFWVISTLLERQVPFDIGWFLVPAPGGEPVPPAGLGSGYFISAATEHPDEAVAFLDFLFDPANARIWIETMLSIPPYDVDTSGYELPALFRTLVEASSTVDMGLSIDVLTPDRFNTVMADGFQGVLLGQKTPEQQAQDLDATMKASNARN